MCNHTTNTPGEQPGEPTKPITDAEFNMALRVFVALCDERQPLPIMRSVDLYANLKIIRDHVQFLMDGVAEIPSYRLADGQQEGGDGR